MDEVLAATEGGTVRGRRAHDGVLSFLGVPYAAAPVGENRFRAPQPVVPWDGVRDALDPGPSAPQPAQAFTLIPEPVIPGEDCLNLSVFTPDMGVTGLPVLVWIHGGGFFSGCNASPWYDGSSFARNGVVVVNINYRLGIEGFLAIEDAPLNRGVLDWLAALRWVHEHIAAFGGDPTKITIGGQSAGAVACADLFTVPSARALFGRAILLSGAGQWISTLDGARHQAEVVADLTGRAASRDELAELAPAELFGPLDALLKQSARDPQLPSLVGPVLDGELITETSRDAARRGAGADIDLLIGCTAEEITALSMAEAERLEDDARFHRRLARLGLDAERLDTYLAHHQTSSRWTIAGQAGTDRLFRSKAAALAEARVGGGAPAFAYEFGWRSPALGGIGAAHCLDLPFALGNLDAAGVTETLGEAPPQELGRRMHQALIDFIVHGDPGWPRYDADTRTVMVFDTEPTVRSDAWALPRHCWPDEF